MRLKLLALVAAAALAVTACSSDSSDEVAALESEVADLRAQLAATETELAEAQTLLADADTSQQDEAALLADELDEVIGAIAELYPLAGSGFDGCGELLSALSEDEPLTDIGDLLTTCLAANLLGGGDFTDTDLTDNATTSTTNSLVDDECAPLPDEQLAANEIANAGVCYRFWGLVSQYPYLSDEFNTDEASCRFVARVSATDSYNADDYTTPSLFQVAYEPSGDTDRAVYPTECPQFDGMVVGDRVEIAAIFIGTRTYNDVDEFSGVVPAFQLVEFVR